MMLHPNGVDNNYCNITHQDRTVTFQVYNTTRAPEADGATTTGTTIATTKPAIYNEL